MGENFYGYRSIERRLEKVRIHHIGIVVKDIEKNILMYKKLGYKQISEIFFDEIQNNKVVFLESIDNSQVIELIAAIGEKSSIYGFKEGYHHICYKLEGEENFFEQFKTLKIGKIFTKPIKVVAIDNKDVVFACLNNGTFVEFIL